MYLEDSSNTYKGFQLILLIICIICIYLTIDNINPTKITFSIIFSFAFIMSILVKLKDDDY